MVMLSRTIAVALLGACLAMMAFSIASLSIPGSERIPDRPTIFDILTFGTIFLSFPSVGLVVVWKRPDNPVGWLFLAIGVAITLGVFSSEYAGWAVFVGADMPGAALVAWLGQWAWTSASTLTLPLALMLFPNGLLPGPRWRPVVGVGIAAGVVVTLAVAILPGHLMAYEGSILNPFGVAGAIGTIARVVAEWELAVMVGMAVLALVAMVVRFRGGGAERQQLKWLLYPVSIFVPSVIVAAPTEQETAWTVAILMLATIPVCAGIAILRYRLYDIDVVIRRTLVYGVLVAILAGAYVGLVLGLQTLLTGVTGGGTLPVALSTLAIAALFGPVRTRVRRLVDRRFYRSRYDAQSTLEQFAVQVRDQMELEAVGTTLTATVRGAVRPASIGLWIRTP
jgi:hypothetical protein